MSCSVSGSNNALCPNYKYDTDNLFTDFNNGNNSINCFQNDIRVPNLQRLCYGNDDGNCNKQSNNIKAYNSIETNPVAYDNITGTDYMNIRQNTLGKFSMDNSDKVPMNVNGSPKFANIQANSEYTPQETNKKEGYCPARGNYTSQLNPNCGWSSAGQSTGDQLCDYANNDNFSTKISEGFCWNSMSDSSKSGAIVAIIIAIIIIFICIAIACKKNNNSFNSFKNMSMDDYVF